MSVPDLLRRFAPTPYVFTLNQLDLQVRIEANDLEIALGIRRFCALESGDRAKGILLWKFIRERTMPRGGAEVTILSNGALRTLFLGISTVITYDRERHEVLGFLAPGVTAVQLTTVLIPLLMNHSHAQEVAAKETPLWKADPASVEQFAEPVVTGS